MVSASALLAALLSVAVLADPSEPRVGGHDRHEGGDAAGVGAVAHSRWDSTDTYQYRQAHPPARQGLREPQVDAVVDHDYRGP